MSAQPVNPALLPPGVTAPASPSAAKSVPDGPTFQDLLARQTGRIRLQFSGHALQRLERRSIDMSDGTLERLQSGVDRAAAKGSRESVVFVDGTAFVVSVKNRTVITAVGSEHMKDHVFTNIDSAVIG